MNLHRITAALRRALRRALHRTKDALTRVWTRHVRLVQENAIYEAVLVALAEAVITQRVNLQRLFNQILNVLFRHRPDPLTD